MVNKFMNTFIQLTIITLKPNHTPDQKLSKESHWDFSKAELKFTH